MDLLKQDCCDICRYAVGETLGPQKQAVLFCRRYPPQTLTGAATNPITQRVEPAIMNAFPQIKPDSWCGEFEADEL